MCRSNKKKKKGKKAGWVKSGKWEIHTTQAKKWPKKARKNFTDLGRILQGPKGGQFTSSGRGKNKVGDKVIE